MGTSTDAVLFYGYHLSESAEIPEAAYDGYLTDAPVQVDTHCSQECEMPFVYWKASRVKARRGYPERVDHTLFDSVPPSADGEIEAFAAKHGLPAPGAVIDADWPEDKASDLGWWLVSWWG